MANITVTARLVKPVRPTQDEIVKGLAAVALTKGVAVYQTSAGTYGIADANDSGKEQFRGIALQAVSAGEAVSILKRGAIAGFALASPDDPVYLSDTPGRLSTTIGTMTVMCGRVIESTDDTLNTELLYVTADWLRDWV